MSSITSTRIGTVGLVAALIVVAGCSDSGGQSTSSDAAQSSPAASTGRWTTYCDPAIRSQNPCGILDSSGREWLLRGVNARVEGVFDVTFDDGRAPLEEIPSFGAEDTVAMKTIGFNLLRLPVQWSAVEPQPGQYDEAYLQRISDVVALCEEAGIQVLVDMHQDAYSKEIGEDGAPLWAIVPPPTQTNKGGELNLLAARLSAQTQEAFASFWRNEQVAGKGLQEHYIGALTEVAKAAGQSPAVIGLDVFNEPWLLHAQSLLTLQGKDPGLNLDMLYDFYAKAIPAVQEAAPDKLVMFEPDVAKNDPPALPPGSTSQQPYSATEPDPVPWPTPGTVYAPHFYTNAFFNPGEAAAGYPNISPTDPGINLSITNSMAEATKFSAPLLLGEFGFTPKAAQYAQTMAAIYTLTNANAISTAQWVWKENSQDSWGFYDFTNGQPTLREEAAAATAQPYPQAISGRLKSAAVDAASGALTVNFVYEETGQPHQIFAPVTYGFKNGFTVACGGDKVEPLATDDSGQFTVECGDKAGEAYVLTVSPK
ncbi:MAG: hypothetical protein QG597_4019 [Actinomycetota bacterium]|nr:hypothetical protein [Actinomycetota bacterium]